MSELSAHSEPTLAATLGGFSVFGSLSPATLASLEGELTRVRVRGGESLFEQGDDGDCMYVIVYGRLRILIREEDGGERVVRELGRGEPVGEMAILTGDARSASVRAVRDTEMIRLGKDGFERIVSTNPQAMLDIARLIVGRLTNANSTPAHNRMSAVALLPSTPDVPAGELAEKLADALARDGRNVRRLDADAVDEYLRETAATHDPGFIERELPRWLHEQESEHDLLVYVAEPEASEWTALCLRQADTVLVVGEGGLCKFSPGLAELLNRRKGPSCCRTELVLLYDSSGDPQQTASWLEQISVEAHHHVDLKKDVSVSRLARMLTGQALGIVFGGGGARGFAHIGVLRALAEKNIPIDMVGGTSMGSIVAAGAAAGWSWEEIHAACRKAFLSSGSLEDYTVPILGLLRGRRYHRMLVNMYGERRIEDLPLPFFCVSTNLTQSCPNIHTTGLLHQWVGASIRVPGLGPPVFHNREVLVDGGIVNNLPADIMLAQGRGPVMAVSVTPDSELPLTKDYPDLISPWRVLLSRLNPFMETIDVPGIGSVLMQSAWINQATANSKIKRTVDLFIEPPVEKYNLRDWHALDDLVEIGYQHTLQRLEDWHSSAQ